MNYWLIKSEPNAYSIDDLAKDKTTHWDGVRNYQARNYMRDQMKVGDKVLFYHSSTEPTAVVGLAKIVKEGYPDFTGWDPNSHHYDPAASPEKPIWMMVDIRFLEKFKKPVTLEQIKNDPALEGIMVAQRGARLSIQPVSETHFNHIVAQAK